MKRILLSVVLAAAMPVHAAQMTIEERDDVYIIEYLGDASVKEMEPENPVSAAPDEPEEAPAQVQIPLTDPAPVDLPTADPPSVDLATADPPPVDLPTAEPPPVEPPTAQPEIAEPAPE